MWSLPINQNSFTFDDLPIKTTATFAKLTTDYYFYFPETEFDNFIALMTKGKQTYDVNIVGVGKLKAVQCDKVSKFPKMKLQILDYEYIIDPETYLYPRSDYFDDKQICVFLFYKHSKPYISLPEYFLKGVPIHHIMEST